MQPPVSLASAIAAALLVAALAASSIAPRNLHQTPEGHMTSATFAIPASIQAEHEAIHSALVAATQAPGRVGAGERSRSPDT